VHVLGIDVGGTKTVCLLGDERGQVIASARGPGANLQAAGELGLEKVLHQVMEDTLAHEDDTPSSVCLGIAGVDRPEDKTVVHAIMDRISAKARVLVVNDALIALRAAVPDGPGIVIVAGTGSIAYGCDRHGRAARAGGWGYLLGDEGSGYWMGRLAMRATVRAADGRGSPTTLTRRVLAHFGVDHPDDLLHMISRERFEPSVVAALAADVQRAGEEGDKVAAGILARGGQELVAAAASVVAQLGLAHDEFTIVLSGGMFKAAPWLKDEVIRLLPGIAPGSRTVHLQAEPALGAVRLALAELRGGAAVPVYTK
jgi:glucosamine kinase